MVAGGDGFEVHPQTMQDYANTVRAQADAMRKIHGTISGLHVSGDSFGKLPNSGTLHSQYEAHAEAEAQNSSQMADYLDMIAEALASSGQAYTAVDSHHAGEMQNISASVKGA